MKLFRSRYQTRKGTLQIFSCNLVAMNCFLGKQSTFCVKYFYENNYSYAIVRRLFHVYFRLRNSNQFPRVNLLKSYIKKFKQTGPTLDTTKTRLPWSRRSKESIAQGYLYLQEDLLWQYPDQRLVEYWLV